MAKFLMFIACPDSGGSPMSKLEEVVESLIIGIHRISMGRVSCLSLRCPNKVINSAKLM